MGVDDEGVFSYLIIGYGLLHLVQLVRGLPGRGPEFGHLFLNLLFLYGVFRYVDLSPFEQVHLAYRYSR